ncbi:malate synthase A [Corallococcus exiguus]|uniref:malate synthase A n=1 Tax=Corallococcus TaxID=83461 RepID=UPI000EF0B8BE|nr:MULTISPECIES: malate synthase A [Corallococcus]NPC68154.1 malate synthase A [Corallococcus exiguus]NRD43192.1 malate synthase A [Corallococcus exiguus]RKH95273.1 malate synthase A [Corallococcus sp. AB038B]
MDARTSQNPPAFGPGVTVEGPWHPDYAEVLTQEAMAFVAKLVRTFGERREALLERRKKVAQDWRKGERPHFLPETADIRKGDWTVSPVPADLQDRRVEITGPVDRKMIINALNSGASVFMADFEDANSPTWDNVVRGQLNLRDAVRKSISFSAENGKHYALNEKHAVLFVRPRGWHLPERHVRIDGKPISGSLFDFGLFFFHNAREQLKRGTGPYFYLPKMQSHLEARLWNDVFHLAQSELDIPRGTIKATVLIETLPAAFEMDEILYELREHSAGLNCGRWDYIFSFIKTLQSDASVVLPDRGQVTMDKGFLNAYSQLLIQTCHRRGAHAMGGMAAFIPIKGDAAANDAVMAKVRADKLREAKNGHDGTWVAHPGLVPLAKEIFDAQMQGPNQVANKREDVRITEADLLKLPSGTRTEEGLRHNIRVGIQYTAAWLGGLGCVPLYNLMEDAATAEISRAQVWQWIHHEATLEDGRQVTPELFRTLLAEEMARMDREGATERYGQAHMEKSRALFEQLSTAPAFEDFLTLPAYEALDPRS